MKKLASILLLILLACGIHGQDTKPYVVMLSMDGFRWDYPEKCHTPNLDRIAEKGVKAVSLQPSFPSKTFPNHYTMATGLYPDHHGIVQNEFLDPASGRSYKISDRKAVEDPFFYFGEPIWVTAEKQGVTAASFFWVGSETPVQNIRPTYWKAYDHDFPYSQRIDTVIYWLSLPDSVRPQLVTWYLDEPDGTGHDEGPNSVKTYQVVEQLDSLLGIFLLKIEDLPFADQVNIIVTSDHGMGQVEKEKTVFLKDYLQFHWFDQVEGYTPNYLFYVNPAYDSIAWSALKTIPHVTVWRHGEVPQQYHYGTNPRTGDFILVADSAWQVTHRDHAPGSGGAHGYAPDNTDMHAIFYAMGPAFKENHIHPTFENTNLYGLICEILGLAPAANDGDIRNVRGMLKE